MDIENQANNKEFAAESGQEDLLISLSASLTPQQKTFADHYSLTNNRKESALKAGYSDKGIHVTTNRLLSLPKIQSYLKLRAEVVKDELSKSINNECYTKEYKLKELQSIIDNKEEKTSDRLLAHAGACKILGLYKDNTQQNVSIFAQLMQEQTKTGSISD